MSSFRSSFFVIVATLSLIGSVPKATFADPLPAAPRSRWLVYTGIGTPVWRQVGGQNLVPWEQPALLELVGLGYTLHRPWLEMRIAGLFGQRLDQHGNSAGFLASINLSLAPLNLGLAVLVQNTRANGTNAGLALTFGLGLPLGRNGLAIGLGGQVSTYPGLDWPVTLVLAPGVSYRFP